MYSASLWAPAVFVGILVFTITYFSLIPQISPTACPADSNACQAWRKATAPSVTPPFCSPGQDDELAWWQTAVIYQCYPRSFKDSNGDGNGDLKGILQKVEYLYDLGVNTIWLNPIFKSPQIDNGYDISNYTDIDPLYGTLADLSALLKKMHSKGMHLILDFVPNHTSDRHPWFVESRKSLDNPKRDWYVWANANSNGGPPSNWISRFGGPAWTFDDTTNQYYLHQYSKFQPDLNYRNSEVQQAMENVLKFWFDFGIDGFRVDAVIFLLEDPDFKNETTNPRFNNAEIDCSDGSKDPRCYHSLLHNYTKSYPGTHDIIRKWRKISDSYSERFLLGEVVEPVDAIMPYYGENNDEFHFPFNFLMLKNTKWTGHAVSNLVYKWMASMPEGAWPNWVLGSHDRSRISSAAGNYLARALNVLVLTLPGTSTTYYGEEIFMTDVFVPPERRQDVHKDRDKARTPMQWDASDSAGFTKKGVEPWLPVATNYTTCNVDVESSNSSSMLSLYKQIVRITTVNEAFRHAEYEEIMNSTNVFAYRRFYYGARDEFIVVINFANFSTTVDLSHVQAEFEEVKVELSTSLTDSNKGRLDLSESISMDAGEAMILRGCSKYRR